MYLLVLLVLSNPVFAEGWEIIFSDKDPGTVDIEYQLEGNKSLDQILDEIPKSSSSISISFYCCLESGVFEKLNRDLVRYYKENMPNEFEKALSSSGNLHNPKLIPLNRNLIKAFRSSRFFKEMELELSKRSYSIVRIDPEKFMMFSTKEPYRFHFGMWLRVEKH